MRTIALLVLGVAFAAMPSAAAGAGAIDLRITYRASESAAPKLLTLRCDPARGTVARPAAACRRLRAIGADAFAPTPTDRVCAQLFGGPMTALVTGTYDGRRVWARLSRGDGCAIGRWDRVAFLFPPPS